MFRWIRKNISTFFLALVLAIGVWAVAVMEADPNEELVYPTPIPLEIVGQDPDLLITNSYSEQIELTLNAPRSIWEELTANEKNVRAILDLSGLDEGEYSLVPQIQVGVQPAQIISFAPISIPITLERLTTYSFPIDVNIIGTPSVGYQTGSPRFSPSIATVSGPKSLVDSVDKLQTAFDISGMRENIEETLTLEAVNENGESVRGISIRPETLQLNIPVSQQGGYKDLAVKVVITGQVANLHRLTNISVFPPVVTVYSDDTQLINELSGIVETTPLDISDISENISARLTLNLPENVLIIGDQSVLAEVSVEAILGSLAISDKPLEVINLDPALIAELSSLTVDIIISGPLPVLGALRAEDLRVIVDVERLGAGSHKLIPLVEVLNDKIKVESILPESIEITLSQAPPATPTTTP